jgi:hypothetical protein
MKLVRGIPGDLLQRIDAADSNIELVLASLPKLIDRFGKALSNLAAALQTKLIAIGSKTGAQPERGHESTGRHSDPSEDRYDCSSEIIDCFESCRWVETAGIDEKGWDPNYKR